MVNSSFNGWASFTNFERRLFIPRLDDGSDLLQSIQPNSESCSIVYRGELYVYGSGWTDFYIQSKVQWHASRKNYEFIEIISLCSIGPILVMNTKCYFNRTESTESLTELKIQFISHGKALRLSSSPIFVVMILQDKF